MTLVLTPAMLVPIFRNELKSGPYPTETHLSELAEYTEAPSIDAEESSLGAERASKWQRFCLAVIEAHSALDGLLSDMPDGAWEGLAKGRPGLCELRTALEALSIEEFSPLSQDQPRKGRKSDDDLHMWAWCIARETADALGAAGHKEQISIDSDNGPVARIGAKIMEKLLGRKIVPAATFADWVQRHEAHLKRSRLAASRT